jgi:hypothetical protein
MSERVKSSRSAIASILSRSADATLNFTSEPFGESTDLPTGNPNAQGPEILHVAEHSLPHNI